MRLIRRAIQSLLIGLVRTYQVAISPALPTRCKYHPSCSRYAIDALTAYGPLRGTILAGWRLLRCNPFSNGGYDPVERQKLFKSRPRPAARPQIALQEPLAGGDRNGVIA
jgi:uncharacterized protein